MSKEKKGLKQIYGSVLGPPRVRTVGRGLGTGVGNSALVVEVKNTEISG